MPVGMAAGTVARPTQVVPGTDHRRVDRRACPYMHAKKFILGVYMIPVESASIYTNKILLVDDDHEERFATSRILRNAGYDVEEAESGQEAIQKAEQVDPDLILLDIVMPEMDGFETCRKIKADDKLADPFVILVSSIQNSPDNQAKGLDNGADGFISRPFEANMFIAQIRSMLRIKNVEKEIRTQH